MLVPYFVYMLEDVLPVQGTLDWCHKTAFLAVALVVVAAVVMVVPLSVVVMLELVAVVVVGYSHVTC